MGAFLPNSPIFQLKNALKLIVCNLAAILVWENQLSAIWPPSGEKHVKLTLPNAVLRKPWLQFVQNHTWGLFN